MYAKSGGEYRRDGGGANVVYSGAPRRSAAYNSQGVSGRRYGGGGRQPRIKYNYTFNPLSHIRTYVTPTLTLVDTFVDGMQQPQNFKAIAEVFVPLASDVESWVPKKTNDVELVAKDSGGENAKVNFGNDIVTTNDALASVPLIIDVESAKSPTLKNGGNGTVPATDCFDGDGMLRTECMFGVTSIGVCPHCNRSPYDSVKFDMIMPLLANLGNALVNLAVKWEEQKNQSKN